MAYTIEDLNRFLEQNGGVDAATAALTRQQNSGGIPAGTLPMGPDDYSGIYGSPYSSFVWGGGAPAGLPYYDTPPQVGGGGGGSGSVPWFDGEGTFTPGTMPGNNTGNSDLENIMGGALSLYGVGRSLGVLPNLKDLLNGATNAFDSSWFTRSLPNGSAVFNTPQDPTAAPDLGQQGYGPPGGSDPVAMRPDLANPGNPPPDAGQQGYGPPDMTDPVVQRPDLVNVPTPTPGQVIDTPQQGYGPPGGTDPVIQRPDLGNAANLISAAGDLGVDLGQIGYGPGGADPVLMRPDLASGPNAAVSSAPDFLPDELKELYDSVANGWDELTGGWESLMNTPLADGANALTVGGALSGATGAAMFGKGLYDIFSGSDDGLSIFGNLALPVSALSAGAASAALAGTPGLTGALNAMTFNPLAGWGASAGSAAAALANPVAPIMAALLGTKLFLDVVDPLNTKGNPRSVAAFSFDENGELTYQKKSQFESLGAGVYGNPDNPYLAGEATKNIVGDLKNLGFTVDPSKAQYGDPERRLIDGDRYSIGDNPDHMGEAAPTPAALVARMIEDGVLVPPANYDPEQVTNLMAMRQQQWAEDRAQAIQNYNDSSHVLSYRGAFLPRGEDEMPSMTFDENVYNGLQDLLSRGGFDYQSVSGPDTDSVYGDLNSFVGEGLPMYNEIRAGFVRAGGDMSDAFIWRDPQAELRTAMARASGGLAPKQTAPEELRMLRGAADELRSGHLLRGPGDGRSDEIPARMSDGGEVLLSDGEYIIPADIVSALGKGSTTAGADALDRMVMDLRKSYTQHLQGLPGPRR